MVTAIERSYKARRGDAWEGESFRLKSTTPGFWNGASAKSQIRKTDSSPVAHEFSLSPQVTQEGEFTILTIGLSLSESDAAKLAPGLYIGDVEVSSAMMPKSTVVNYDIEIVADVTRA